MAAHRHPGFGISGSTGRAYLGLLEFAKNRLAVLGLLIITALIFIAAFAPQIAPYDPIATNLTNRLQPLSASITSAPMKWAEIYSAGSSGVHD